MAEWWNLDQVMIWTQTRDPNLVALAAGDAQGIKGRQVSYLDFLPADDADEADEPQTGGTLAGLVEMLDSGKLIARDAVNEAAAYPLDIPFSNYHCVVSGEDGRTDPHLVLRSAAYPFTWHHILIDAESVRRCCPPKAPAEMQQDLAALHEALGTPSDAKDNPSSPQEPAKRVRPLTRKARAERSIAALYPEGLASADDEHGKQAAQIRQVQADVWKRDKVKISADTVRFAAGLKEIRGKP